jgi:hypothetical protein
MDTIVKMIFGSHLYGTDTPDSDRDYKGIFVPSLSEILRGRVPRTQSSFTKTDSTTKNTAKDVDDELYSLPYFLELACEGQTVAMDMLHAPYAALTTDSVHWIWAELVQYRSRFYTKNLSALVGYARRQAAKYGIKGSRLAAAKTVLQFFTTHPAPFDDPRLIDVWDDLPAGEHLHKLEDLTPKIYQVCGKKLQSTVRLSQYVPVLRAFVEEYGARAQAAERNEGVDWKAVSHAVRAGLQTKKILVDGGFEFPLSEANTLREIKQGRLPYSAVAGLLEDLIDECEQLAAASTLPARVDRALWDAWLEETLRVYYTQIGSERL